jgi:hypothetical protein
MVDCRLNPSNPLFCLANRSALAQFFNTGLEHNCHNYVQNDASLAVPAFTKRSIMRDFD